MKLNVRLTGFGSILSAPAYEFRIGFLAFALANKKISNKKMAERIQFVFGLSLSLHFRAGNRASTAGKFRDMES